MSTSQGCSCSGGGPKKQVLIYACSGCANVAEAADKAARQLMDEGLGSMFCLAGLGAEVPKMVETAKESDVNLAIDGCPVDCAKKIFDKVGLANARFVRVTDLGIEKAPKGTRTTNEEFSRTLAAAKEALAAQ
jgi:uncharacterized metal-binding protein